MAIQYETIEDLERAHYDPEFLGLVDDMGYAHFAKADAPVLSTTTGVFNAVFGANVWAQINQEANVLGSLPKYPWPQSGWRVQTDRAGTTADGGVAENAALPDTIKPTFAEVSTKPKTIAHNFDVSEIQDSLATTGADDAIGAMEHMRIVTANKHREAMNQQLLVDVDTLAGDGLESIDRVCSAFAEIAANGLGAGDADIYGVDRDAGASWADAYLDTGSGTDRVLTDKMIRTADNTIQQNGGNPTFWVTGHDTYTALQGLYDSQVQYNPLGEAKFKISVNGIDSPDGFDVGITIATLYAKPLIISKDVAKDTISRLYLLDTSDPEGFGRPRLGIAIMKPTQYFEAGMNRGDPFGIDRIGNEGMFRTSGELICTFFAAQGKIRDLK